MKESQQLAALPPLGGGAARRVEPMIPHGQSRKAYQRGIHDAQKGLSLADNPYQRFPSKYLKLSSWWQTGFIKASEVTRGGICTVNAAKK